MIIALELGLLFAIMALGVYLTYRVLDFPDLTVDGSFTTGASVAAILIVSGVPYQVAIIAAVVSGLLAGVITGLLHVWGNINPLLAGILTQIALYSINLRIMGKANLPLLRETTIFSSMREARLLATWTSVGIFAVVVAIIALLVYWFLGTNYGVALRATGDNDSWPALRASARAAPRSWAWPCLTAWWRCAAPSWPNTTATRTSPWASA